MNTMSDLDIIKHVLDRAGVKYTTQHGGTVNPDIDVVIDIEEQPSSYYFIGKGVRFAFRADESLVSVEGVHR